MSLMSVVLYPHTFLLSFSIFLFKINSRRELTREYRVREGGVEKYGDRETTDITDITYPFSFFKKSLAALNRSLTDRSTRP